MATKKTSYSGVKKKTGYSTRRETVIDGNRVKPGRNHNNYNGNTPPDSRGHGILVKPPRCPPPPEG